MNEPADETAKGTPSTQRARDPDELIDRLETLLQQFPTEERDEYRELAVQTMFSGPLPPPALLARYDDILPGSASS